MYSLNLKTRMTVSVSLLTVLFVSVLAYAGHIYFQNQIKQVIANQQFIMVSALGDQVDEKLQISQSELTAAATSLADHPHWDRTYLNSFFSGRTDTLAMFDNGVYLFSADGTLIYSNLKEGSLGEAALWQGGPLENLRTLRSPQISEPFRSPRPPHHPIIVFSAPVLGTKGEVVAVLAGSLDLLKPNFLGRLASVKLGEKGELCVVTGSGTIVVNRDRSRILARTAPGANPEQDRVMIGSEETGGGRKVPIVRSYKPLKTTGWILSATFLQSEAYAPVYRAQQFMQSALLAAFAVFLIVVWIIMKYLTAPLLSFTRQIRELTVPNSPKSRIKIESADEIGMLGQAFNLLLDQLDLQKTELKKQLDFSQMIIDTIPNPIFYKNAQGIYLGCNQAFQQFSGFSQEEIIGKTVFDIVPASLAARYHQADLDAIRNGELNVYESRAVYADGSERDVIFFKTAFFDTDEKPGGTISTMVDITSRKRDERALQVQKDFAENLVQNSVLPTFVLDSRHRVIIWNRACEVLTGVDAAELVGTNEAWKVFYRQQRPLLADLIIDGRLEEIPQLYKVHAQSNMIQDGVLAEGWFRDRRGVGHIITLNASPIRDQDGTLIAVIQTLEDITVRKHAEQALEKTRRRLQLILDAAGEGIYGIDLDGMITFVNTAAARMVGWEGEQLLGRHAHSVLHHSKADGAPYPPEECRIQGAVTAGSCLQVQDEVFWRKDGTCFPVDYISTPLIEAGKIVGAVVIYRDTTESKVAEEQLHKLSQAVLQSPVSIVITDILGNIEFINPKFTEVSGYELPEVLGKNTRLLKSGRTAPEVYQELWQSIASGHVWTGELYNRCKDGNTYCVHATISPIRSSSGVISHYMAFMESMNERKRLEEQLRQSQKMEAIGQLAGGVAHDFNNILTVIMGFGHMLQTSLSATDPLRSHMNQILAAAERATHLTKSLLAFSRKQVMLLKHVELNELTRKHLKFLVRIIGEDVTLHNSFSAEPLTVMADAGQIEQVLMNLAANARDAMPGGGELFITTEQAELSEDFYRQHGYGDPGSYALITITDTGCGMNPETRNKIFEPFFTTKAPGRGTGLGLSIVYGIVKQHGGYITIESELGVGTTFKIYLPLSKAQAVSNPATPAPLPQGGHETILVVEDDPAVRALVQSVLEGFGYHVLIAESGGDAIPLFEERHQDIDLALLDVIMPKMNGKQLCEKLKKKRPDLKVLFLSGYTADLIQDRGILMEGVDLIMKPVQPLELARKLRRMLDQPQAPRESEWPRFPNR